MIIPGKQIIEEQVIDAFRLRVESDAGVEIRRAAFDDHDQCRRVGFV
jgi:hypothetical protein